MYRTTCFALLAMLAACATTTPDYDARFGDAVRQGRLAMTIHPEAPASSDQAAGIDGQAAHEAIGRYHDSYKAPPPVTNVINIGGTEGASR
jgi:hypothetical protein